MHNLEFKVNSELRNKKYNKIRLNYYQFILILALKIVILIPKPIFLFADCITILMDSTLFLIVP